ncbi:MAG: molybdopterin-binding protein, partial [Negativicutes bacterium]|nr:molybdopterin-binding protein [Negativicutes bacterium]
MSKTYLDCVSREAAERLWRAKLREIGYFHNIPEEMVPLEDALGRITAQCQYARRSVPHYNGAAMDGIAVHAADTFGAAETSPKRLRVLPPGSTFEAGGCFIVDTGDLLPAGTNAVIMREDVYFSGGEAEIAASATPWQHVRIIGEDVVAQEIVLPEQHQIAPADIAVLLAAGIDTVNVIAKPKVTVIPTGSELVAHGDDLAPGKILDVNSHMLCAAVRTWGGVSYRRPIVPDDYQLLKEAVASSLAVSDMVITNAGTSAGTEDFTAAVLAELG